MKRSVPEALQIDAQEIEIMDTKTQKYGEPVEGTEKADFCRKSRKGKIKSVLQIRMRKR